MLDRLPESRRRRERRPLGTVASVVAHVALIGGAVAATAGAREGPAAPPPAPGIIYVAAGPQPQPLTRQAGGSGGGPVAPRSDLAVAPPLVGPVTIDVGIPPVDPGARVIGEGITFGPEGGSGAAGTPTGSGGAPGGAWTAAQVERPVLALESAPPRYPELLRSAGVEGTIVAQFVVDTLGRVEPGSLRFVRATHPLFAESVRAALPGMRFLPAEAAGHRVRQLVELPFAFTVRR